MGICGDSTRRHQRPLRERPLSFPEFAVKAIMHEPSARQVRTTRISTRSVKKGFARRTVRRTIHNPHKSLQSPNKEIEEIESETSINEVVVRRQHKTGRLYAVSAPTVW